MQQQMRLEPDAAVKQQIQKAIDAGISADQILNDGLLAGMNVIGEKFKANKVFIPEVEQAMIAAPCSCAADRYFSAGTSTPRSMTFNPLPSNIIFTRFTWCGNHCLFRAAHDHHARNEAGR